MSCCYYIKRVFFLSLVIFLTSCRTRAPLSTGLQLVTTQHDTTNLSGGFDVYDPNFNSIKINGDVEHTQGENSNTAGVDIRMIKNEKILISVSYIIPLFKILLTPDRISYSDAIHKTYYKGDYNGIKNILDVELTFKRVQDMLLGLPFREVKVSDMDLLTKDSLCGVKTNLSESLSVELWKDKDRLLRKQCLIDLGTKPYKLDVTYERHKLHSGIILPGIIKVMAERNGKCSLSITYNACKVNEVDDLDLHIPKNYKPILSN